MNNARRKQINDIADDLETLLDKANELAEDLESMRDEEQEYFDNMPEGLQGSEKGEMAQEAINNLDEAASALRELLDMEIADKARDATV